MILKRNDPIVFHFRSDSYPVERGGITVVFDPETKHFGVAVCSRNDNYNRKLGKAIALGRAKSDTYSESLHSEEIEYNDVKRMSIELAISLALEHKQILEVEFSLCNEIEL